jgi:Cu(I)/Ag(I) efflux system membrane protein CusA/SilA
MSIAVWVGMIALMGLDAETGVFMLLYLDLSYEDAKKKGLLKNDLELREAILHGAVKRVRPKIMTVLCAMMGLLPIMWSTATGSDVMKRIAAPMVGGLVTIFPYFSSRTDCFPNTVSINFYIKSILFSCRKLITA